MGVDEEGDVSIGRMVERGRLEVEVAVARGQDFLVRAVFRPPDGFSIGSSPDATLTIPDAPLRPLTEVLAFAAGRPTLLFSEDSRLEVDADGERLSVRDLLARGMAEPGDAHHVLPLAEGVRAVLIFGALKVLLKVRVALDVSVWNLDIGDVGTCGGCASTVLWPSATKPGALIPCPECGDLNRLIPESGPDAGAFDDDEEATELESPEGFSSSSPEQLPGVSASPAVTPAPTPMSEDEAPTDPGRDFPLIEGPTTLPTPSRDEPPLPMLGRSSTPTPTVDGPGFGASPEPGPAPDVPPLAGVAGSTAGEFVAPRRRRPRAKPNYAGWGLVFFGMSSGLAGLVLLALSALRS
jgi:hypothetical protein